jgi:hypothetical protein
MKQTRKYAKFLIALTALLLALFTLSGCLYKPTSFYFEACKRDDDVDHLELIDEYMTGKTIFAYYKRKILEDLCDVTPEEIKDRCRIYRISGENGHFYKYETFLVVDDEVYHIGDVGVGFGVTEFAYVKNLDEELLFFIYQYGTGMLRSAVGVFDFNTKKIGKVVLNGEGGVDADYWDIYKSNLAFCDSSDGEGIGVCFAYIEWGDTAWLKNRIKKLEMIVDNILVVERDFGEGENDNIDDGESEK